MDKHVAFYAEVVAASWAPVARAGVLVQGAGALAGGALGELKKAPVAVSARVRLGHGHLAVVVEWHEMVV